MGWNLGKIQPCLCLYANDKFLCLLYSCIRITLEEAKRMNAVGEMWFCNYKECEDAFGNVLTRTA